jgi:hypothetical protein
MLAAARIAACSEWRSQPCGPVRRDRHQLLQVIVDVGTFHSLKVPAERLTEVDALVAELEKARDAASS